MKSLTATYSPKKILNVHKYCDGGWFWVKYSAHPYLGCSYGCLYCYEWDKKYTPYQDPDDFDRLVKVKDNAAELLAQELATQPVDIITLGDWQPVERKYRSSRKMLEIALELGFPVFINEKSPLITRDLDLLAKINRRSYVNVGFSIMTSQDDETRRLFEPKAPSIQSRFEAMEMISSAGIMTGTVFIPILPFIYDNEKNIKEVIKTTKQAGGKYVLDGGLTLFGYCKDKYYQALKSLDPKLIANYEKIYKDPNGLPFYYREVHSLVKKYCQQYRISNTIPRPVKFFPGKSKINKLVAEKVYLKARELQFQAESYYRILAYLKVAHGLDELDYDVFSLYQKEGSDGLKKIPGVGDKMAIVIEEVLADFK
ncbi:MAG: radical SAM protein [candidate division WOR-3 bacterium]|nr:radical SAM protein [candidate division WOR-3 bacterium]